MALDFPDWTDGVQLVPGTITALTDFPDWTKALAIVGGGPFVPNTPQTIPGQYFWHAADLITGVADGALLTTWPSLVASPTYDLGNTGSFRPTLYTTTASKLINSRPAVWFAGGQDMFVSPVPSATTQPWTIFMVAGLSSITGTQVLFDNEVGVTESELGMTGGGWYVNAGNTLNGPVATTGPHLFVWIANGASSTLLVDGVSFAGNAGTNSISGINIGSDRLGAGGITGFICEQSGYTRVLNSAELATLHAYAQSKWGTP